MHPERIDPFDRGAPERVSGLGAPITVRLRLPRTDAPLLRAQIEHLLEDRDLERAALLDMLDGLDAAGDTDIDVLWPTAYAALVLRGAVAAAQAAVEAAPHDAQVVAALESARLTLAAFLAIDNGGLDEVHV